MLYCLSELILKQDELVGTIASIHENLPAEHGQNMDWSKDYDEAEPDNGHIRISSCEVFRQLCYGIVRKKLA